MNKCKCGANGFTIPVIECGVTRWQTRCDGCGVETQTWIMKESAETEWNRMNPNFPTCSTCEYYHDGYDPGLCIMHDRGTEETWTCPDHLPKDVTNFDNVEEQLLHEIKSKKLLDTDFGEPADELLQNLIMVDRRDYENLKKDLAKADHFWTYWFEQHNELDEELTDQKKEYGKLVDDYQQLGQASNKARDEANAFKREADQLHKEVKYWQEKWLAESKECEKLLMLFAKIKEVIEG